LALSGVIYRRITLFFALNRIFFSANENGTVKQNNQPISRLFLNYTITLQETEGQKSHCLANRCIRLARGTFELTNQGSVSRRVKKSGKALKSGNLSYWRWH